MNRKPLAIQDDAPVLIGELPATDTLDAKIYVSGPNKVLGRVTSGDGPHEEIDFGDLPGGGVSIIDKTYAEMEALIAANDLTPGQFYRITDASGTDLGFVTHAVRDNEISVSGVGGYLNADFQGVGVYDGVVGETGIAAGTQKGIWRTGFETISIAYTNLSGGTFAVGDTITGGTTGAAAVIVTDDGSSSMTAYITSAGVAFDGSEVLDNGNGVTADMDGAASAPEVVDGDVVIWNLTHYQVIDITLLTGDNPANNTNAYTILAKTVADVGYITAWDISEYDFAANEITLRSDNRENVIRSATAVPLFQFGNDQVTGNVITGGYADIKNLIASFNKNTIYPGAVVENIKTGTGTAVENNILENGAQLTGITAGANCSISRNKIGQGATLGGSTTMGDGVILNDNLLGASAAIGSFVSGDSTEIVSNILDNGGSIYNFECGTGCYIQNNRIGSGSQIGVGLILGNTASISGNNLSQNINLSQKTLADSASITDKTISLSLDQTETIPAIIIGTRLQTGFSDITGDFDITGLTTLDHGAAAAQYVGIFNLTSSNATEAINQIDNAPTLFPVTIKPAAGLVLTVTGTPLSTPIAAGQIALTTADVVLDGDKGEYLVLQVDANNGHLYEVNRVAGLL